MSIFFHLFYYQHIYMTHNYVLLSYILVTEYFLFLARQKYVHLINSLYNLQYFSYFHWFNVHIILVFHKIAIFLGLNPKKYKFLKVRYFRNCDSSNKSVLIRYSSRYVSLVTCFLNTPISKTLMWSNLRKHVTFTGV